MSEGIRCMWMRGGTSKGGVFLAQDLPSSPLDRDALLLRIMGSPDLRQIDGMGSADPLTSKVAVVSRSAQDGIDLDYLFLQVFVDQSLVSDAQNCGNMLAAVAPFAIERGLVEPKPDQTQVRIHMVNSGQNAVATVATPNGALTYQGDARIDGVPGSHAPITLEFSDTAGSTCGALLPTGNVVDELNGIPCTLIDNGMPCIVLNAADVGVTGYESREVLDANSDLKTRIETIRLQAGPMMRLGDVSEQSIPKIMLVAPPQRGGAISVRSLIPHRVHAAIGVLGAVTVATACRLTHSTAAAVTNVATNVATGTQTNIMLEHPSGELTCIIEADDFGAVTGAALLRTARKLMDGEVFP